MASLPTTLEVILKLDTLLNTITGEDGFDQLEFDSADLALSMYLLRYLLCREADLPS